MLRSLIVVGEIFLDDFSPLGRVAKSRLHIIIIDSTSAVATSSDGPIQFRPSSTDGKKSGYYYTRITKANQRGGKKKTGNVISSLQVGWHPLRGDQSRTVVCAGKIVAVRETFNPRLDSITDDRSSSIDDVAAAATTNVTFEFTNLSVSSGRGNQRAGAVQRVQRREQKEEQILLAGVLMMMMLTDVDDVVVVATDGYRDSIDAGESDDAQRKLASSLRVI